MRYVFNMFGGRRLYTLAAAVAMFVIAVLVNQFLVSSTSSSYYARLIQRDARIGHQLEVDRLEPLADDLQARGRQ